MPLTATWFSEGRAAQHPPDPRYPLGVMADAGRAPLTDRLTNG
jgi:hypothetical protein